MKFKFILIIILGIILSGCAAGVGSSGLLEQVSVALDQELLELKLMTQ